MNIRTGAFQQLSESLFVLDDTCNVYLVRDGDSGLLIDTGSGLGGELASDVGVTSLEWVLHTHFHRDQCWGTPRLVEQHDVQVAVPEHERYLFECAREHWATKRLFDDFSSRRNVDLAPGEDISVDASLEDYETFTWRGISFYVLPAKGHTLGSVTLIAEIDGKRIAFTGDLINAGGHIHELHALEYGFGQLTGVLFTLQSLHALRRYEPELILPSHSPPLEDVTTELDLLQGRLADIVRLHGGSVNGLPEAWPDPVQSEPEFVQLSEHLLWSGPTACSSFYVLLSGAGEALLIDYGHSNYSHFHFRPDLLAFESMRFVVHHLDQLRERFGVRAIEVVCPTHHHDDHVCGIPYLQRHHGTACWALDRVADAIENPEDWARQPCTLRQPIGVERRLGDGETVTWRGFELTFRHTPGHTDAHSMITAEIDGSTVAFSGDVFFQSVAQPPENPFEDTEPLPPLIVNVTVGEGLRMAMPEKTLAALRATAPDLICPGHGDVFAFDSAQLDEIEQYVERRAAVYTAVVEAPADQFIDFSWAQLRPYFAEAACDAQVEFILRLRNNLGRHANYAAHLIPPPGWIIITDLQTVDLEANESAELAFLATAPSTPTAKRLLLTAEIFIDGRSYGPITEALLSTIPALV